MVFQFNASQFDFDFVALYIAFSNEEKGQHYFLMQREEDSLESTLPNMDNIYIELDDQGWGGYGGIDAVILTPNSLTVKFNQKMTKIMGNYSSIKVTFTMNNLQFQNLESLLRKIMFGYAEKLLVTEDKKVLV